MNTVDVLFIEVLLVLLAVFQYFDRKKLSNIEKQVKYKENDDKIMWSNLFSWVAKQNKAVLNMRKRDENILRRLGQVLDEQGNHCDDIQSCIDGVDSRIVQIAKKTATLENCINQVKNEVLTINSVQVQQIKMEKESAKILKMVEDNMQKVKNRK